MRRRDFIRLLGSGAAIPSLWPLAARAQQGDRMRRIGVVINRDENDPEGKALLSGFTQGLAELGWTDGRNVRMDVRWGAGNVDRIRMLAKELVDLQPDVILAHTTPATAAVQRETRTIPIVFVLVSDPVGDGFVAGLPRPGGNITGFINLEAAMAGKWLELLTEIAPGVKRVAIMFNPDTAAGGGSYFLPSFEAAARSLKVEPMAAPVHSDADIETVMTSLGRKPEGGLVVMGDSFMNVHRAPTIRLATRNNVPAVYPNSFYARDGGLLSYGTDLRASAYLVAALAFGDRFWVHDVLEWRVLRALGKYSYSFYLYDPVTLTLIFWGVLVPIGALHHPPFWLATEFALLSVGLTIPMCYVSYVWFERPAIRLGARIAGLRPRDYPPARPARSFFLPRQIPRAAKAAWRNNISKMDQ
jgi:putative ABC transport system substrate-binding protein